MSKHLSELEAYLTLNVGEMVLRAVTAASTAYPQVRRHELRELRKRLAEAMRRLDVAEAAIIEAVE